MGFIVVLAFVPQFAAILRIPFSIIAPTILAICAVGAFTVSTSIFDIYMMLIFGVIGYIFKKLKYPLPRWCWPLCWETEPKKPSASPCCPPAAARGLFL